MADASGTTEAFEAVLYPNPPLSDRAFAIFMALAGLVAATVGGFFIAIGAWPIGGFFGLDLLLLWLAFRAVRRNARRYEWVRVDRSGVIVRRFEPDGRATEWRFDPCWLRVHLDEPPGPQSLVILASHGRTLTLGGCLTPAERREFADALRAALIRLRHS